MILTEQEISEIHSFPWEKTVDFVRRIEARIEEKLKAQEPVGVFADVNRLIPNAKARWEQMVDEAYDGKEYVHLYRNPLPPDDVVRDAERYSFLVAHMDDPNFVSHLEEFSARGFVEGDWPVKDEIDAAIDAAMEKA